MLNLPKTISQQQIEKDLIYLGVMKGDTLNIKASLSSIGLVEGGAATLINALIAVVGDEGTIMTDSFIKCYKLPLSKSDAKKISNSKSPSYAGALANAMINHPSSIRSAHPIQKFAAIGRRAKELMESHTADDYAYNVLKIMIATGGKNLKIGSDEKVYGIGTTHVAIGELGFQQKRDCLGINYKDENDEIKLFKLNWSGAGHGFNKFIPKYQEAGAIIGQGYIGYAASKITDMKKTYEVEKSILSSDPTFQLCNDPMCVECRLSWSYSNTSLFNFLKVNVINLSLKTIGRALLIKFRYKFPF